MAGQAEQQQTSTMDVLGNGLITLLNGMLSMLATALNPMVVVGGILALSLAWLSLIELDELDRQGTKPEIRRGS